VPLRRFVFNGQETPALIRSYGVQFWRGRTNRLACRSAARCKKGPRLEVRHDATAHRIIRPRLRIHCQCTALSGRVERFEDAIEQLHRDFQALLRALRGEGITRDDLLPLTPAMTLRVRGLPE
jgi:hypothetical protein